jgi:hypothetical protein
LDLLEAQALNPTPVASCEAAAGLMDKTAQLETSAKDASDDVLDDFEGLTEAELAEMEKRALGGQV